MDFAACGQSQACFSCVWHNNHPAPPSVWTLGTINRKLPDRMFDVYILYSQNRTAPFTSAHVTGFKVLVIRSLWPEWEEARRWQQNSKDLLDNDPIYSQYSQYNQAK